MSFLLNWWYTTSTAQESQQPQKQQATENSLAAAYNVAARLYLNELKTKLKAQFRAENAERCIDVENAEQSKVIERRRKAILNLLEKTQMEIDACTNTSDLLRLEARQKRMRADFL